MNASTPKTPAAASTVLVDACGTMWRLRSLVAMGHDTARIASALRVPQSLVQRILRGDAETVSVELRNLACQLWNAWWDKRPPEDTHAERRRAAYARHRAEENDWCPPLGLDEDQLDQPGYRPYSRYREATGTGTASEFRPAALRRHDFAAPDRLRQNQQPACARALELSTEADRRWLFTAGSLPSSRRLPALRGRGEIA
jgi:hypothetical protein